MAKLFLDNGWLNWSYLWNECKFIMTVTGARGIGKTYGLLKYVAENDERFIYIRRLKSQLDNCVSGAENNPFKRYNLDTGRNIRPVRHSGTVTFVEDVQGPGLEEVDIQEKLMGYGVALSTVATIRGSDYSDVTCVIFDEYIAMKNERPIKDEFNAFMHFIETVNRNRELNGNPPVKIFMLGNANQLMNPYFLEWHFMKTALKMIAGRQMVYRTPDNNRIMVLILDSPISKQKEKTALYQNAENDFIQLSLNNAFETDPTNIKSVKLSDCQHIVSIGPIGIYRMKSTGQHYVSETINRSNFYEENAINVTFFRTRYRLLKDLYLYGNLVFENFDCEMLFRSFIGL